MTVESNYVIAIATLSDWLKRLAPVFQPRDSSRAFSELQIIARNCDWFIALFAPAVIGRSNCFGLVFRQSFENRSNKNVSIHYCHISFTPYRINENKSFPSCSELVGSKVVHWLWNSLGKGGTVYSQHSLQLLWTGWYFLLPFKVRVCYVIKWQNDPVTE